MLQSSICNSSTLPKSRELRVAIAAFRANAIAAKISVGSIP
jgi:hypothetical protein